MLWGFFSGASMKEKMFEGKLKWAVFGVVVVAVIIALLFATGVETQTFNLLFGQSWSESFWTNFLFVAVIAVALAVILKS